VIAATVLFSENAQSLSSSFCLWTFSMSSLAQLPEVFGFFSYSRDDDRGSDGRLSNLRKAIQGELSAQLGRTERNFGLFQDQEAIALDKMWETEIAKAIDQAVFFIPIVTPRAVGSPHCKFEFESFLARERALYRDDLVFPILYLPVLELEDERSRDDPVLSIIRKRQYVDWRTFRHLPGSVPEVSQSIDHFCSDIALILSVIYSVITSGKDFPLGFFTFAFIVSMGFALYRR
jgi:TIR domain